MNDRFLSLQLFVRVARTGSFSAASREFGVSQPTASRMVATLEKKVGVALLTRTTRAVTLTEAGADYLIRAELILAALDEADHAARGGGELRGTLRIAASPSLATRSIMPILHRFSDPHPALRIEFILSDAREDLIGESVDIAVRTGALHDSSAVAKRIGVNPRVVVASPSYLTRAGIPQTPPELAEHTVILAPPGRTPDAWSFTRAGKTLSVRVEGRFILNGSEAATAAAVNGLGILSCGFFGVMDELRRGALVRLFTDWEMGSAEVNIILPAGRAAKPSARAFTDFLAHEFQALHPASDGSMQ